MWTPLCLKGEVFLSCHLSLSLPLSRPLSVSLPLQHLCTICTMMLFSDLVSVTPKLRMWSEFQSSYSGFRVGVWHGVACSMDGGGLPLEDRRRQQHRDDRLWRRELDRATSYNLKRVHCPCYRCKGRVQCSLAKVKDHLISNGREPTFRVWRGPGARDSSDNEWEQEFRRPPRPHEGQFDIGLDMHGMVEDAF